jgi:hypothetical protein
VVRRENSVFFVSTRVRLNILGLDGRDPGLARGVERRIAPLKFRKAERESFNRNRRVTRVCARGSAVRKSEP